LMLLLVAAVFVTSCGGGAEETTTTTPPITSGPVTGPGLDTPDLVGTEIAPTEDTPQEYVEAMEQARPVVMLFYVPGGADDTKVLDSLSRLESAFSDYVFLFYDYKAPGAYGDLSTVLDVDYPPEVVMVDGSGVVRTIWNGFVDEGTLNQALVDLGQG